MVWVGPRASPPRAMAVVLVSQKQSRLPGRAWMPGRMFAGRSSVTRGGPGALRARLLSVFGRSAAPSLGLGILVAASFIVVETLVMLLLRQLSPLEVFGTLYLLGVVVVSTVWAWSWR
jgi:hypothetical protein